MRFFVMTDEGYQSIYESTDFTDLQQQIEMHTGTQHVLFITPVDAHIVEKHFEKKGIKPNTYYGKITKCGNCEKTIDIVEHKYCPQCGEKIDWSEQE